jgi:hypothetical protein
MQYAMKYQRVIPNKQSNQSFHLLFPKKRPMTSYCRSSQRLIRQLEFAISLLFSENVGPTELPTHLNEDPDTRTEAYRRINKKISGEKTVTNRQRF